MKKIIIVIFSLVFLSSNVFANNKYLSAFDKWLLDNGHTQYLNIEHTAGCKKLIQKIWFKKYQRLVLLMNQRLKLTSGSGLNVINFKLQII